MQLCLKYRQSIHTNSKSTPTILTQFSKNTSFLRKALTSLPAWRNKISHPWKTIIYLCPHICTWKSLLCSFHMLETPEFLSCFNYFYFYLWSNISGFYMKINKLASHLTEARNSLLLWRICPPKNSSSMPNISYKSDSPENAVYRETNSSPKARQQMKQNYYSNSSKPAEEVGLNLSRKDVVHEGGRLHAELLRFSAPYDLRIHKETRMYRHKDNSVQQKISRHFFLLFS